MKNWVIGILIAALLAVLCLHTCSGPEVKTVYNKDTVYSLTKRVEYREKEVVKWKQAKDKIVYRVPDTIETKEVIYKELLKADTIIKIDNQIIASQDSIIFDQKQIIHIQEIQNKDLVKENKKLKRKAVATKIIAGAAIVLVIFLAAIAN